MLKNYITVAFRNLVRNKLYSAISIVGLSLGITCCLLIFLYVQHEWSFDSFHANADNVYRLIQFDSEAGELSEGTPATSFLLRSELAESFPEVERSTIVSATEAVVTYGEDAFPQSVVHVNPDFFKMFSFPLLQGDAASVLSDPLSVVLTPEMAHKYFGEAEPLGKTLSIQLGETSVDVIVSGIIEEAPANSSIQYDFLIAADLLKFSVPEEYLQTWNIILFSTFVQLRVESDIAALEENIGRHVSLLASEEGEDQQLRFQLQLLGDIHLNPELDGEMVPSANPVFSYILTAIALAVLLIACINFTTLTIGQSGGRVREVGLRKVFGAERRQIMKQFWGEALLMGVVAMILGIGLAELLLPTFSDLAQRQLISDFFSNWGLLPAAAGLTIVTALVAGIYPSVLLSGLMPAAILRGTTMMSGRNRLIQGLVTLQFAVSVFLIIVTLIISSQIGYVRSADVGYNKDLVVTFPTGTEGADAASLLGRFRTELSGRPEVADVTGYSFSFGDSWLYINLSTEGGQTVLIGEDITRPGFASTAADTGIYFYVNWVDPHYIPTLGIKLTGGRNFSEEFPSDVDGAIVINETAARKFGLDDPIGQKLPRGFQSASIVGVVKDFHFYPLHRKIEPLVLHLSRNANISSVREVAVRIRPENIPTTLSLLQETWSDVSGGKPFTYEFLDERVAGQYSAEQRWQRIVKYSSFVSVFICCLGLFGLSSLSVSKRIREVGIRRTLGASEANIVGLISRQFMIIVAASIVIAGPVAYLVMDNWLDRFAYRTEVGFGIPAVAGCLTLVIALVTVSYYAIKAARANPVEALRYE